MGQPAHCYSRESAAVSGEPVAGAPDSLHAVPAERGVDLPAQITGVDLDDVRVPVVVRVPHVMQDVGLGNGLALAPQEELEQREFAGVRSIGRPSRVTVCADGSSTRSPAESDAGRGITPRRSRARSLASKTTNENGLVRVVVGAEVEGVCLVVLTILGGQHENRRQFSAARSCSMMR